MLDTTTGQLREIDLGVPFMFEAAWNPNSRQILGLGLASQTEEKRNQLGLYFIDVLSGTTRRVLPSETFSDGDYLLEGGGLALSPDGLQALVKCPVITATVPTTVAEDRVCQIIITVQS